MASCLATGPLATGWLAGWLPGKLVAVAGWLANLATG